MLLRFSAQNHLSIRERFEFSLVATKLKDTPTGLISVPNSNLSVVPSAIIYGPNASGKSNLISALGRMFSLVENSHAFAKPDSSLPYDPFALDETSQGEPTSFDVDFIVDEVRYHYGFSFNRKIVIKEWLYSFPNGRSQTLYTRDKNSFSFGRKLKGRNQIISELTRPNSLFLSAAAQNDHDELTPIYRFFRDVVINRSIAVEGATATQRLREKKLDPRVIGFLNAIGTGVVGYTTEEEEYSEPIRNLHADMLAALNKLTGGSPSEGLKMELFGDKSIELRLSHRSNDGTEVYFDLDRESSGTRRLLVLLSLIFEKLDTGGILIIDEIDASLHTQACELMIALFSSKTFNQQGAQIIVTTHDTNLLNSSFVRRDQVWFCEKGADGSSEFYPLSEIDIRNKDNFERGYLQGRFGALPFRDSVDDFLNSLAEVINK